MKSDYDAGIYDPATYDEQALEPTARPMMRCAAAALSLYPPGVYMDVGAGLGVTLDVADLLGWDAYGVDLHRRTTPGGNVVQAVDLRWAWGPTITGADLVWCTEVAEHLPAESGPFLIRSIAQMLAPGDAARVIWTAAQPGQGGEGHINCRPRQHWEDAFYGAGLVRAHHEEALIRHMWEFVPGGMWWMPRNLLVLRRGA